MSILPTLSVPQLESSHTDGVVNQRPLGSDREIFSRLEIKWRNWRAVRWMVAAPITIIGSIAPFLYVSFGPWIQYSFNFPTVYNAEWWFWQLAAVALGLAWMLVTLIPYRAIHNIEKAYDEALDALDAKDYLNPFLVKLSTGRRPSRHTHLTPLTPAELQEWGNKMTQAGPLSRQMWGRWVVQDTPVRHCDLILLEQALLEERWAK